MQKPNNKQSREERIMKSKLVSELTERAESVAYGILAVSSAATILYTMSSVLNVGTASDQIVTGRSVATSIVAQSSIISPRVATVAGAHPVRAVNPAPPATNVHAKIQSGSASKNQCEGRIWESICRWFFSDKSRLS
jgi:hypothetical protein